MEGSSYQVKEMMGITERSLAEGRCDEIMGLGNGVGTKGHSSGGRENC